jgi:hypothetical protein
LPASLLLWLAAGSAVMPDITIELPATIAIVAVVVLARDQRLLSALNVTRVRSTFAKDQKIGSSPPQVGATTSIQTVGFLGSKASLQALPLRL